MEDFYSKTLRTLLNEGWVARDSEILVACGGDFDCTVLQGLGFSNVTMTSLDGSICAESPYPKSVEDVEALPFRDGSFDVAIVHQGLHHCRSPHRGLLELYRVSRSGVVVFEPRETALVKLGVRLGFGQQYEIAAVAGHNLLFGGVNNTTTPNYVYRWTEDAVESTLRSYAPETALRIRYFYAFRIPRERILEMKNRALATLLRLLLPFVTIFTRIFPRESNCFAFAIEKPELPVDLHPWLQLDAEGAIQINEQWVRERYNPPAN